MVPGIRLTLTEEQMGKQEKVYPLERLGLLDETANSDLDNITALARLTLGATASLVTIIRPVQNRQYIISHCGMDDIAAECRQVPLSYSVCKHVQKADRPVAFHDTRKEPLLQDNPAVQSDAMRSYLGVPIHNGTRTVGALCCLHDSPRHWSEEEIEILTRLGQCVDGFLRMRVLHLEQERANSELKRVAEARAGFLAHMSHELRTPLTGVIGASKLLRSFPLKGEPANLASVLDRTSTRLLDMVNDTLDLAKIDAGQIEVTEAECDLRELMQSVVDTHAQKMGEEGPRIELDYGLPQDHYLTDSHLLGSVLDNLIGNAVKFTREGTVTLSATPCREREVAISVQDTGIGIARDRLAAIFDEFEQSAPDISREYGGTGLGLAIVKRQVELMFGEIEVTSELGKGTTFRILLPLEPVVQPEEDAA